MLSIPRQSQLVQWLRARWRKPETTVLPFRNAFPGVTSCTIVEASDVPTPEAVTMPMWRPAAHEVQGPVLHHPAVFTAQVDNAYFCGTNQALLNADRAVVAESIGTMRPHYPFQPDAVWASDVEPISGIATALRAFRWNYYHMLVDCLPRLFLLREAAFRFLDDIQLLYSGPAPTPLEQRIVEAFELENVHFVEVEKGRMYHVEHYLFLSFLSRQFSGFLPPFYVEAFRKVVLPKRPSWRNRRVLLTRAGASKRRLCNSTELAHALAPLGFEVIAPEALPLEDQIALFYDAEYIVASHGAGLTNLLFATGARVLELFPTSYVVPHYYYLCKALSLPYEYVCSTAADRNDDFDVDVAQVQRIVQRWERM